jgi:lipid-binding SYLF domain-containing protein
MANIYHKTGNVFRCSNLLYAVLILAAMMTAANSIHPGTAIGATAAEIERDVDSALKKLYASTPAAKELSKVAKGILVFPDIIKGGLIVGGQYGVGALREGGKTVGYYNTVAASYGLQAGVQKFGFALFFMTDSAIEYIEKSSGWEIGVGPSIVIVDEGLARSLTTTTAKENIYAFFFDQKGLMAGLGLQGSKISKITPDKQ